MVFACCFLPTFPLHSMFFFSFGNITKGDFLPRPSRKVSNVPCSLWGNLGMAMCQEMSTLPAGYIPQRKVKSVSSSGSLYVCSLCVWSVVGWLIVYQDGNFLYPRLYSQNICWSQIWGGNILMARPSTFLESRTWWGHDYGKVIYLITNVPNYRLAKNLLS